MSQNNPATSTQSCKNVFKRIIDSDTARRHILFIEVYKLKLPKSKCKRLFLKSKFLTSNWVSTPFLDIQITKHISIKHIICGKNDT